MEIEHRGFTTCQELVDMIKRYDNVIKEARYEQEQVTVKQKDLEVAYARMDQREEQLRVKAQKLLALKLEQEARLETIEKRLALLTKLDA